MRSFTGELLCSGGTSSITVTIIAKIERHVAMGLFTAQSGTVMSSNLLLLCVVLLNTVAMTSTNPVFAYQQQFGASKTVE